MREAVKPPALRLGSQVAVVAPASPAEEARLKQGCQELVRLGYCLRHSANALTPDGYFAGSVEQRSAELSSALSEADSVAVICARGGYGTNYLLERLDLQRLRRPKILLGHSDVSSLQIFLWQKLRWVTFYGPMVAAGFDLGTAGYDANSFRFAVTETHGRWSLGIDGEVLVGGEAEGVLLGGCLTLVEATLGTPWELETAGAILLLEDRGIKPYQVDRMLMHLKQAGKFVGVRGIVFGEFPESDAPVPAGISVGDVFRRVLGDLGVPVVGNVPFGHTARPMLTLPLGVRARLSATGAGQLDILESAVVP